MVDRSLGWCPKGHQPLGILNLGRFASRGWINDESTSAIQLLWCGNLAVFGEGFVESTLLESFESTFLPTCEKKSEINSEIMGKHSSYWLITEDNHG